MWKTLKNSVNNNNLSVKSSQKTNHFLNNFSKNVSIFVKYRL